MCQYQLGNMWQTGTGTKVDLAEAAKWYEKAAKGGNKNSCRILANWYKNGTGVKKDMSKAKFWSERYAQMQKLETEVNSKLLEKF